MRKFTVAEYHRMIDVGILGDGDRIELLEGWIVAKMTHDPLHIGTIQRINKHLARRLPGGWDLRIQAPVTTGDSEPEPDVAVVRGNETSYDNKHPGPGDIGVLIEVSVSSLSQDRREKGRLYARAGVPYYWIANVIDRSIEVYSDPDSAAPSPHYRSRTDYRPGDTIPLVLDGQIVASLPVTELLP